MRNIEQTLSNLTESLLIISTFSHQINGLLRSLNGGDNLRSLSMALAVNPVSTVKRLFSKEIEQKPEDLLGTYVKIINIMLFIQDNANQISPRKTARAIKKLMNALFLVSNTLSFVNNKIQKLPRIESLEAIDSIWNILGSNQKLIADFVENSKVITNLKLHRSISNLVNSYVHLISGAIDIGNILVTGEAPVYILGIRTSKKRKVGTLKEIAVGVASLYAFSKLFNEILKIIIPLFENLQKIHEVGRIASYNGVKTIVMAYSNIVSALIDLYNIFHNGTLPNYAVGVKAGTKQITEDG